MPSRVGTPPDRPTLIFDGDCGFCRYWIARWRRATGDLVEYVPYQEVAEQYPEIPVESFARSVQLILPDGGVTSGAEAVFGAMASLHGLPLWIYRKVPLAARVAEAVYAFVAARRPLFSRVTRWLWGNGAAPPSFHVASRVFLVGLAATYLIAFASLAVQIKGLAGSNGVMPIAPYLRAVGERIGWERFYYLPTLAWIDASDASLLGMCIAGIAASLVLMAGLAPMASLFVLWALYLSASVAVRLFLNFQWDALLLETGLLAIILHASGWRLVAWRQRAPSRAVLFLLHWLLFRLMFGSGWAKIGGGDFVWRDLTAVAYHYETQPIPTWTAWYMHQLPLSFHKLSTAVMFAVEILLPFLIFTPRRPRMVAFWGLAGLQVLIAATGNFAFFNLLSLVLLVPLVEDASWPGFMRRWFGGNSTASHDTSSAPASAPAPPRPVASPRGVSRWLVWPLTAAVFVTGGYLSARRAFLVETIPAPVVKLAEWVAPFRSLNAYGLFVNMTEERPEITIEGSHDGRTWVGWEFRWKPGDPRRAPPFVAPHQPRLDWQMWFAALGDCQRNPWVMDLMQRLKDGSPDVIALLERDPFTRERPLYVRAVLWDYRFTSTKERASDGSWWRRTPRGLYCPVLPQGQ